MSFLEVIACNSHDELTDWLGERIHVLLQLHADQMTNTLPLMEEIPLHPFLSTGLSKMILEDINNTSEFNLSEPVKVEGDDENRLSFGSFRFPLQGMGWNLDLDELVQLARA